MATFSADGTHVLGSITEGVLPSYTWGTQPSAVEFGQGMAWFSDIGRVVYSDGTKWLPPFGTRTTPLRVATYGDSTSVALDWESPANMNTEEFNAAFPGSGTTTGSRDCNFFSLPHYYPMAYLVRNMGIGGQTTTDMAARDVAVAGITRRGVIDLLDASVDVVIYRGGSINDFITKTAAQLTDALLATIYDQHKTILDRLIATGAFVIDEGVAGYGVAATADTNARRAFLVRLNALIDAYINTLDSTNVVFLSPLNVLSDGTGNFYDYVSSDGVHHGPYGANLIAEKEAAILNGRFGVSAKIRYPGTNLATNPLLLTVTSPGYGTLATGFSMSVTNATRDDATVELRGNTMYQTFRMTPTGAGALSCNLNLPLVLANLTLTSGNSFGVEYDFFLEKEDGSALNTVSVTHKFSAVKTAAGNILGSMAMNSIVTPSISGHAVFNPIVFNEDAAALTSISLLMNIFMGAGDSVAANVMRAGVGNVRCVKL